MRYLLEIPDDIIRGDFKRVFRTFLDSWLREDWTVQELGRSEEALTPAEEDLLDELTMRKERR